MQDQVESPLLFRTVESLVVLSSRRIAIVPSTQPSPDKGGSPLGVRSRTIGLTKTIMLLGSKFQAVSCRFDGDYGCIYTTTTTNYHRRRHRHTTTHHTTHHNCKQP